jgi:hypothetical protein
LKGFPRFVRQFTALRIWSWRERLEYSKNSQPKCRTVAVWRTLFLIVACIGAPLAPLGDGTPLKRFDLRAGKVFSGGKSHLRGPDEEIAHER